MTPARLGERCILIVLLSGCASEPQIHRPAPILSDTPFYSDAGTLCGPSALATVLGASGVDVAVEELTQQVYLPGRRGTVQAEMLAGVRRHNRLIVSLGGDERRLLDALRAGHPVLVLQRLGLFWQRSWHYAVLIGFDIRRNTYILRSGVDPEKQLARKAFLRTWMAADGWGYIVTAAGEIPEFIDAQAWLEAAVGADAAGDVDLAFRAFDSGRVRWPDHPMFHFGVANVMAQQHNYTEAAIAYRTALEHDSEHVPSINNLAFVLHRMGHLKKARTLLERAMQVKGLTDEERLMLSTTLGEILSEDSGRR